MTEAQGEFSWQHRKRTLDRFKKETFDVLIIGGGITGAAAARDAVSRGLTVALVELNDFASGTSSKSSKLIHGGLRYLENLEFALVFESLAERAKLMKLVPHRVRPIPFYFPVYHGDKTGRFMLGLGMWLYDLLALLRTPAFHKGFNKKELLKEIPGLKEEGLTGGFRYFDASMWDDVLTVETLRSAARGGAAVANYVEAVAPLWKESRIVGFRVRDREAETGKGEIDLRAHRVILCAGPWTDLLGAKVAPQTWKKWLQPSRGVHLVFDLKRLAVPGAVVMFHPDDGRIAFVIPRPDMAQGVVIVGTTDGPSAENPTDTRTERSDVAYLLGLLQRYFPGLSLTEADILSAYVGVRPLVGAGEASLQKVSREHRIDEGPGGVVVVAGGKYTTHRNMGEQIIDFTLARWRRDAQSGVSSSVPAASVSATDGDAVNPCALSESVNAARALAAERRLTVPERLYELFGSEAIQIVEIDEQQKLSVEGRLVTQKPVFADPEGIPLIEAQLRYFIRNGMVLHLDDFMCRRCEIFLARKDHGWPWAERLAQVLVEELGLSDADVSHELDRFRAAMDHADSWKIQSR